MSTNLQRRFNDLVIRSEFNSFNGINIQLFEGNIVNKINLQICLQTKPIIRYYQSFY